jgi:methionyl-tRNA formyltransferase
MRLVYLGTPEVAVPPLEALHGAGYQIVAVVTQPDSLARRSSERMPSPVRAAAERLGLAVQTPATLKDPDAVAALAATRPDLAVVAAYGEILRREVLAIPPHGFLNIHPSLLPRWRGPAPVAGAILAGDPVTGVTVMRIDPGMDSGPILARQAVPLAPDARAGQLTAELFVLGSALLLELLPPYVAGTLVPEPQDHSQATVTRLIRKDDGRVDWSAPAVQIERTLRAYDPWPGAFTLWQGQPLRLLDAQVLADWPGGAPPGTLLDGPDLLVATGAGALRLRRVQPASKRPMEGAAFRRGLQAAAGAHFD